MGDYPWRGWIPINSRGLCGRKAMDCEIRDFSRENSRGFRNPWLLPGESSWHGDFGSDSHQCPSRGSLLALATPLRSVNTADDELRIGTISQAHAITCWACVVFMVCLLRASMRSALSGATKWPTGAISLTRRAYFVILSASPAVFLLRTSIQSALSGAIKHPSGGV